jgi:hypothetical protein
MEESGGGHTLDPYAAGTQLQGGAAQHHVAAAAAAVAVAIAVQPGLSAAQGSRRAASYGVLSEAAQQLECHAWHCGQPGYIQACQTHGALQDNQQQHCGNAQEHVPNPVDHDSSKACINNVLHQVGDPVVCSEAGGQPTNMIQQQADAVNDAMTCDRDDGLWSQAASEWGGAEGGAGLTALAHQLVHAMQEAAAAVLRSQAAASAGRASDTSDRPG